MFYLLPVICYHHHHHFHCKHRTAWRTALTTAFLITSHFGIKETDMTRWTRNGPSEVGKEEFCNQQHVKCFVLYWNRTNLQSTSFDIDYQKNGNCSQFLATSFEVPS